MFNIFNKKSKLEFVSLIPELTQTMPIIEAKKQSYTWYKDALQNYKQVRKSQEVLTHKISHIARCPGIIGMNSTGYVHRAWQDLSIKTNGDGKSFQWISATSQKGAEVDHNWKWDYLSHHPEELGGFYTNTAKDTLSTVIKVQSPWMVYIPKGYYLLSMPIPYPDRHEFTAAIGLLDGDDGPNFLNVQLFWHKLNNEVFIPAGTPLCQYILIKKDNTDVVVRGAAQADIENLRLRANVIDSQFVTNYGKLKNLIWKK